MATATTEPVREPETAPDAEAEPRPYRITAGLYERMIESGAFPHREAVYLWRGRLVEKTTKGRKHNVALTELNAALLRVVPPGWHVRPEQPVTIADDGMPEPDFTVVRGSPRDYLDRDATAEDVALVIEVADSSLRVDAGATLEDYAGAAIPVYWIVNIPGRTIDVYTRPSGRRDAGPSYYAERHSYQGADTVPLTLDGREVGRVPVREVLP